MRGVLVRLARTVGTLVVVLAHAVGVLAVLGAAAYVVALIAPSCGEESYQPPTVTWGSLEVAFYLRDAVVTRTADGWTLALPIVFTNVKTDQRYEYDLMKSFSVDLENGTGVLVSSVDGLNHGILAPRESRRATLTFQWSADSLPVNVHFRAIGLSLTAGDFAIVGITCVNATGRVCRRSLKTTPTPPPTASARELSPTPTIPPSPTPSPSPTAVALATAAPPAPTEPPPPASPPPPPTPVQAAELLAADGSDDGETDPFTTSGPMDLCWDASGRALLSGPWADLFLYPRGQRVFAAHIGSHDQTASGCVLLDVPAGTYHIEVVATDWTRWRLTVRSPGLAAGPGAPEGAWLVADGSGDGETDPFTTLGRAQVCWEVRGRAPAVNIGPSATFDFRRRGQRDSDFTLWSAIYGGSAAQGCAVVDLPAGTYRVTVRGTPWSRWRLTVGPAP